MKVGRPKRAGRKVCGRGRLWPKATHVRPRPFAGIDDRLLSMLLNVKGRQVVV